MKKNPSQIHIMLAAYNAKHGGDVRLFGNVKEAFQFGAGLKQPGAAHGIAVVEDCHAVAMSFHKHRENGVVTLMAVDPGTRIKGGLDTFEKFPELLNSKEANPGGHIVHSIGTYAGLSMDLTSCVSVSHGMIDSFREHSDHLEAAHNWVLFRADGRYPSPSFHVVDERVFQQGAVLPLTAYKDIQSATRLAHILNIREGAAKEIVNRKKQTLHGRLEALSGKPWVDVDPTGLIRSTGLATPSDRVLSAAKLNLKMSGLGVRYLEEIGEGGLTGADMSMHRFRRS